MVTLAIMDELAVFDGGGEADALEDVFSEVVALTNTDGLAYDGEGDADALGEDPGVPDGGIEIDGVQRPLAVTVAVADAADDIDELTDGGGVVVVVALAKNVDSMLPDGEVDDVHVALAVAEGEPLVVVLALIEKEADAVIVALTRDVALDVGVPLDVALARHFRSAKLHERPVEHHAVDRRGVHAGPALTFGHHDVTLRAPHAGGKSTVAGSESVKAACGAHAAVPTPWQESVAGAHWRPSPQSVAARGPVYACDAFPARALSQAPHAGAAVMPRSAARPR